jgi:hypothetical protein
MSTRRPLRLALGAAAIAIGILLAGVYASRALFEPPVASTLPIVAHAPASEPEAIGAKVVSVTGRVEKGSSDGRWIPVASGERLLPEDSLRTDPTGRAELTIGEKSSLAVGEGTQLKIRELSRVVHQVQLTRGRIVAHYDADGERVLRIEDEKGQAVAQTRAARFSVLANGQALAVATETGKVNLEAQGKSVEVSDGTQAVARDGEAPSAATPISAEVLLKIARAQADPTLCAVVEGTVDPGAEVELEGAAIPIDANGRFHVEVARQPGRTAARLAVRDASGRRREQQVACAREPRAAPMKLKMNWTAADAG